jgi:signal transduction histidine kinase
MDSRPISKLIYVPNYGRPLSRTARYVSRVYRYVIAAFVSLILIIATVAYVPDPLSLVFLVVLLIVYGIYTVGRQKLSIQSERRWYTPRAQFVRGEVGMIAATMLDYYFAVHGYPGVLWPIYLLPILIISEHCATPIVIAAVVQASVMLTAVQLLARPYETAGVPLASYASIALQILWITVFAFILHYLVRNIDARDKAIEQHRKKLVSLLQQVLASHDPNKIRLAALEVSMGLTGADWGSFWIFDSTRDSLRLATGWLSNPQRPSTEPTDFLRVLACDSDTLPAHVVRTQREGVTAVDKKPVQTEYRVFEFPPLLPAAKVEFAIPIPKNTNRATEPYGVLCFDFEGSLDCDMLSQCIQHVQNALPEIVPALHHAELMEQQNRQSAISQRVIHSLDRDTVVRELVDVAITILGFDFATVSLVDDDRGVIRSIYASPNIAPEWIKMASHPITSQDIQADVVRHHKIEILRGWDARFDKRIWRKFRHADMLRAWLPLVVNDNMAPERCIGTLEVGYFEACHRRITSEQLELLSPAIQHAAVAIENAENHARLRRQAQALNRLYRVTQDLHTITSPARLSHVLRAIGQSAEEILDADIVILYEYDAKKQKLSLVYLGGEVFGKRSLSLQIDPGNVLEKIITEKKPYYSSDARHDPYLVGYHRERAHQGDRRTFTVRQNIRSFAGVPLMVEDQVVGVLCVNYRSRRRFAADECEILELFARQAAFAKENARLYAWARESAITSERDRLSRELHHSVSQELHGLELKTKAALSLLPHDNRAAERQLQEMIQIAGQVKSQIGFLISELRSSPDSENFWQDLTHYTQLMQEYFGLDIDIKGDNLGGLPAQTQFVLKRIAREALNNIVHHSQGAHVHIRCVRNKDELQLLIQDDGIGFDQTRVRSKGRYGLVNIRDYAESVGGRATISSQPGHGTRVEADIPIMPKARGKDEQ